MQRFFKSYSTLQFLITVTCILIELVSICITIRRYCTAKSRKRTQERCWPDSIPTFLFTFQIKSLCLLHVEESQNTSTSHSEQCVRYLMQTDGPVRKPKLNRIQTHQWQFTFVMGILWIIFSWPIKENVMITLYKWHRNGAQHCNRKALFRLRIAESTKPCSTVERQANITTRDTLLTETKYERREHHRTC